MQNTKLIEFSRELIDDSQFGYAESLLHIVLKFDRLNIDAHFLLSKIYLNLERLDLAKNHINTAGKIVKNLINADSRVVDQVEYFSKQIYLEYEKILVEKTKQKQINENQEFGQSRALLGSDYNLNFHNSILAMVSINLKRHVAGLAEAVDITPEDLTSLGSVFEDSLREYRKILSEIQAYEDWQSHTLASLNEVRINGLYLEFGVHRGGTINRLAKSCPHIKIHGFDSFMGLPDQWEGQEPGYLSLGGQAPPVGPNVELHIGWFKDTLPPFIETHKEDVAFIHIDCDLYSSTRTVFEHLADRIKPGTVMVFDEYPPEEYRAFQELGLPHRYLTHDFTGHSLSLIIE